MLNRKEKLHSFHFFFFHSARTMSLTTLIFLTRQDRIDLSNGCNDNGLDHTDGTTFIVNNLQSEMNAYICLPFWGTLGGQNIP